MNPRKCPKMSEKVSQRYGHSHENKLRQSKRQNVIAHTCSTCQQDVFRGVRFLFRHVISIKPMIPTSIYDYEGSHNRGIYMPKTSSPWLRDGKIFTCMNFALHPMLYTWSLALVPHTATGDCSVRFPRHPICSHESSRTEKVLRHDPKKTGVHGDITVKPACVSMM